MTVEGELALAAVTTTDPTARALADQLATQARAQGRGAPPSSAALESIRAELSAWRCLTPALRDGAPRIRRP